MLRPGEAEPSRKITPTTLTELSEEVSQRIDALELLRPRTYSWLAVRTLLESRNSVMAGLIKGAHTDIVDDERDRWIAELREAGVPETFPDFVVAADESEDVSFLVVGDPGEADRSQYVTVPAIEHHGSQTNFMVVMSDVIYPTGETNDYVAAFYEPYRNYARPIYALPGNHDWYALLTGFMWHFCDLEPLPETSDRLSSYTWQERLARFLWLRPKAPNRPLLKSFRDERAMRIAEAQGRDRVEGLPFKRLQPGPYFAIDTRHVRIVCIDTGTSGTIDRDQASWLCRVSERRDGDLRPRILLTGKPLYVNGRYEPTDIVWQAYREPPPPPDPVRNFLDSLKAFAIDPQPQQVDQPFPFRTVDEVVRHAPYGYVAAIGGDVHNYQRYPVRLLGEPERQIQYVVSGGGGAFLSPTHLIDKIDRTELAAEPTRDEDADSPAAAARAERVALTEDDLRLFPLRGDSIARYTKSSAMQLRRLIYASLVASAALLVLAWWLSDERSLGSHAVGFLAIDALAFLGAVALHRWATIRWRIGHPWETGGQERSLKAITVSVAAGLLIFLGAAGLIGAAWLVGRKLLPDRPDVGHTATAVAAVVVLALGAGALVQPWFRVRVRLGWAALTGATAAYLVGWGTDAQLLAVAIASFAVVFVARLKTLRHLRMTARIVVAAIVAVIALSEWRAAWSAPLIAGTLVGVAGALAFGGPRYSGRTVGAIAVAVFVGAQVLWTIPNGQVWIVFAALALLAAVPALYILYVAWSLLLDRPVDRDVASRYVATRLGIEPERAAARAQTIGGQAYRRLNALLPPNPARRILYGGETVYSAIFDFNDQPFYKSFLRIDASGLDMTISCFGVTDADKVRLEDEFRWHRDRGWTASRARLVDPVTKESVGSADVYRGTGAGNEQVALDLGARVSPGTRVTMELTTKQGAGTTATADYEPDAMVDVPGAPPGTRLEEVVVSAAEVEIARGVFL